MPAEWHINDNGTLRKARELWVNDAGTLRKLREVWINDNGVLRKVFSGDPVVTLTNRTVNGPVKGNGTASTATFALNASGTTSPLRTGEWLDPADDLAADAYQCRAINFTGNALKSGLLNTWMSLTANRAWVLESVNQGYRECSFTVEIRHATTLVVHATATITLTAQSTGGGGGGM